MKMRLLATAALATLLGAGVASANNSGWYGGVEAGWHSADDLTMTSEDFDTEWSLDFDNGLAAFSEIGYRFSPRWRAEFEAGYRHQDLAGITDDGSDVFDTVDGNLQVYSAMANVLFDFMPDSNWTPFLGLGAGWAQARMSIEGDGETNDLSIHEEDNGFAYQALAGLAWHISDRTDLNLTYRYFVMDGGDFDGTFGGESGTFTTDDYKDHAVTIGVRHAFGAAPAPVMAPPPAPAPVPVPPPPPPAPKPAAVAQPMSFIVYFPFDQSILTPEANDILDKAADYAKNNSGAKIMIVGHTDKSGSDGYNLRLSQKRAKVVVDGLAQRGIDTSMVGSDYKGESAPAVDTPDGTKEPLNRRSTIDITFGN